MKSARLVLEDGKVFSGHSFGGDREVRGEVVFNTSMFGYQEILTDPSYAEQIVTMASPQMGNVGVNAGDAESERPHALGMAVRQYEDEPSSWRSQTSLDAYFRRFGAGGIEGIDTRQLVRHLRNAGSQRGVISTESVSDMALVERARGAPDMEGRDLVSAISTPAPYGWTRRPSAMLGESVISSPPRFHVVAYDYGLKRSMMDLLVDAGCRVTVVPAAHAVEAVLALRPDGIFLTNGPGDPAAVPAAAARISGLLGKVPLFGICLGHQLLARAVGGRTYKLKFGHRGANHPVVELATGKVEITSQNHGFAVDAESVKGRAVITHHNLNDGTVEGLAIPDARAFSVQYHPEASPGPHDARHLFGRFVELMDGCAPSSWAKAAAVG